MNVIMGNTVLYGATGGELYASGSAGERFAVRNSGATAVVEGTGHHVCEYMTGGVVVVLGKVGYNVGAGMTGGSIYIYDEKNNSENMLNSSYVKCMHIEKEEEAQNLRALIEKHYAYTKSLRAGEILDAFDRTIKHFCKVTPL
jgi:glutamate synthase domain-containing protein 3